MRNAILIIIIAFCFLLACKKPGSVTPTTSPKNSTLDTFSQYGFPYTNVPNTKDIVMYEVNPLTFSSSNNLEGVTARLDSIKALGVNVIWLMPTYPIGILKAIHSPYCIKDYMSVNPLFGTLTDLQTLVSQAHAKGMAVIMDWVGDHTSFDHAWITQHPNWYHKDAIGNIESPYSGTDTFKDVAWLDYSNVAMRHAMLVSMVYWIKTANVDGYRCDFASNVPGNFWTAAIDTLNLLGHKLIFLSENEASSDFTDGFQLDYSWNFYNTITSVFRNAGSAATFITQNITDNNAVTVSGDAKIRFLTNHDEEASNGAPPTFLGSETGALAAFVVASFMGGVPMIYNGDEVGNPIALTMYQTGGPYHTINWLGNPSILAAYKKLMAFHNSSNVVKTGSIQTYSQSDISIFKRYSGADTVLVMVNTRDASKTYNTGTFSSTWMDVIGDSTITLPNGNYTFSPYQYLILKK